MASLEHTYQSLIYSPQTHPYARNCLIFISFAIGPNASRLGLSFNVELPEKKIKSRVRKFHLEENLLPTIICRWSMSTCTSNRP